MKIAAKQIQIIKMAQRAIGIDDADYRALLVDLFGTKCKSSTQLTIEQGDRLIDELQNKGWKIKPKERKQLPPKSRSAASIGRNPGHTRTSSAAPVIRLVTQAELEKVMAIAKLISWRYEDGLVRFLEARMKIKGGKIRTSQEAYLAIQGLRSMFESGMKKIHGSDWWVLNFDEDPATMRYILEHAPKICRHPITGSVLTRPA